MEQADLLKLLVMTLEQLGTPYVLTGSLASSTYGEPRYTHDIDVVVVLDATNAARLCAAFPAPDYYCSAEAAAQAVRDYFQFNIIHLEPVRTQPYAVRYLNGEPLAPGRSRLSI